MSSELKINPDGVRGGATRLDGVGTDFTKDAGDLKSKLQAEGQPWGDDESGQNFAKDYVPAADAISKAVGDVAAALTQIAKNLKAQADAHQSTDTGSARTFNNTQV
ncbi:hypothetical protein LWC34_23250 [Kibdelosporangium philippinense]|uniref:WXG100 family type VII secretion target n=1 Tax=Kibdelosporangium philippinense TaxID=211113 RepID=A0ABS8ZD56_9PSEU|nr:hypothetical protein [Kibdelosporangium philippinense]MCE7005720.1 hypothetical protein [Kibdelosporangium philippinense]